MVKITDPNENNNKKKEKIKIDTNSLNGLQISLTARNIKDILKPEDNNKNTRINLRLNNSVANQIKLYANQHETTVTTVITDILTNYYSNKRVIQGVLELDKPVKLIIPTSKELIADFIEHEVNVISDLTEIITTLYNFNEKDIKRLNEETQVITINQVNNLLDVYNYDYYCYSDLYHMENIEETTFNYHRGLIVYKLDVTDNVNNLLLIEVCTIGNELIEANLVDVAEAIEVAKATDNYNLIEVLENLRTIELNNVFESRIRELALEDVIKEQTEIIQDLETKIGFAEEEANLSNALLEDYNSIENLDNDTENKKNYIQKLEAENKELKTKLNQYEIGLNKLEIMLKEYTAFSKEFDKD